MNPVLILRDGRPVKLNSDFEVVPDIEGFLLDFKFKGAQYKYFTNWDLKKSDEGEAELNDYFPEDAYKQYLKSEDYASIDIFMTTKFDFSKYLAKEDDVVDVSIVDFAPSSSLSAPRFVYYRVKKVMFPVENWPQSTNVRNYLKLGSRKIDIPPNATMTSEIIDLSNQPTGFFYQKNFLDFEVTWVGVSDEMKEELNRLVTRAAFTISYIVKDILPLLLDEASLVRVDNTASRMDGSTAQLDPLESIIFFLKRDWGYYYGKGPAPHQVTVSQILPPGPDYSSYTSYYRAVLNFYNHLYRKQNELASVLPGDRIWYLMEILPYAAFTIMPLSTRIEALRFVIQEIKFLPEYFEEIVLKIIYSFTIGEADQFLDFLLSSENGAVTNFQRLYSKMDDERWTSFLPGVGDHNNRRNYVFFIWELWKSSKYNFFYTPPGQSYPDSINTDSFFLSDTIGKARLNTNCLLEFTTTDTAELFFVTSKKVKFQSSLECDSIDIEVKRVTEHTGYNRTTDQLVTIPDPAEWETFGQFHLYQAISVIGYESNLDLKLPQASYYPAFVFYYAQDFDRLADLDAKIQLAFEITLEVALMFFTGGAGALLELGHLKYLTKVRLALNGALGASDTVLIWKRLSDGFNAVSVPASVLMSLNTYLGATTNNAQEAELRKKVSMAFMVLTLTSMSFSLASRRKAVQSADEALAEIKLMTSNGIVHQLPNDVKTILEQLKGYKTVNTALAINKLADYSNLASKLQAITDENLVFAIAEILSTRSKQVLSRLNESAAFIDSINDVSKVPILQRLTGFYEEFYRISNLQQSQKNGYLIFSERVCTVAPNQSPIPTSASLHALGQVSSEIEYGISQGLLSDDLHGIIMKSYRANKQAGIIEVHEWIFNYKQYLNSQIAYCFNDATHYYAFIAEAGPLFAKYKLGDELFLGGSSLLKLLPPDADFVLYFSPKKFDELLDHYQQVLDTVKAYIRNSNDPEDYTTLILQVQNAINESRQLKQFGKLNRNCMINFEILNGQPKITRFMSEFSNLNSVKTLNVANPKKRFDFSVFKSEVGNRAISLPPETKINL